ncbi:hypothetical protein M878_03720 [Streptomyces roseochromogenus subsp. oscitans DS 12.976]|uniref:Uncharacterized protein n=1 Tax=Streptomyces roseochromogenus subsp. oscitans DS 12.976 TaxID=1352936 RepID=V6L459_STRRC|nr:hypothetical protein M878_03720 [Streptomyces roseochromogenus subsp. oscitans DS 12.976]
MSNSATDRAVFPQTLWAARGRHTGPVPEEVVRRTLRGHKESGDIDDFAEPPVPEDAARRVFEARRRAGGTVTVRARLTLVPNEGRRPGHEWRLVAEAERPWDETWPSPATLFWPEGGTGADGSWDHHATVTGLRFRQVNALPADDKEMRRRLRDAAREAWCVNVVVHEAMTPDEQGRLPLARLLPPGLRHRVVEHRAAPHQFRAVNWALKDLGCEVPRGGAVLLPPDPAPEGYDPPGAQRPQRLPGRLRAGRTRRGPAPLRRPAPAAAAGGRGGAERPAGRLDADDPPGGAGARTAAGRHV